MKTYIQTHSATLTSAGLHLRDVSAAIRALRLSHQQVSAEDQSLSLSFVYMFHILRQKTTSACFFDMYLCIKPVLIVFMRIVRGGF